MSSLHSAGSSPRMRGAGADARREVIVPGIIPAHAGSSSDGQDHGIQTWDHPRACGEQSIPHLRPTHQWGSSPRMRGADHRRRDGRAARRIIPAHAGSSRGGVEHEPVRGDHPRACGEQGVLPPANHASVGSSPRMRGAARHEQGWHGEHGIIPAHAGSSTLGRADVALCQDHPRACGEQRLYDLRHTFATGIIPAHAGSSPTTRARSGAGSDHPRACGEQATSTDSNPSGAGSSPRMRGAATRLGF